MAILIIPRTKQRVLCSKLNNDIVVEYNTSNDNLDYESVVNMGTMYNPDGTVNINNDQVNSQGLGNNLDGTYSGIKGRKNYSRNIHGDNTQTHILRKKFAYLKK